jgi:hypothetical protein
MAHAIISADSHVTEPPGTYVDRIDRGGWDPEARLGDQDTDGVAAEVIYPTVGMLLCNTAHLTEAERRLVLHDNVAELYGLALPSRAPARSAA